MTDEEANTIRCLANEIILKLKDAKQLEQLKILAMWASGCVALLEAEKESESE